MLRQAEGQEIEDINKEWRELVFFFFKSLDGETELNKIDIHIKMFCPKIGTRKELRCRQK